MSDSKEDAEGEEKLAGMCPDCGAKCCRYYTVALDTPENAEDFDELRWLLAHEGNYVYVDEGEWHLNIEGRCKYLDASGRCAVYSYRPEICRSHGLEDVCEYDGKYDFDRVFKSIEEIEEYAREVLPAAELATLHMFPKRRPARRPDLAVPVQARVR